MTRVHIRVWTKHWLLQDPDDKDTCYQGKSVAVVDFLRATVGGESTHVVVAYDHGSIVGVFRFSCDALGETLFAAGTWVRAGYRRAGLAGRLWDAAIARTKPGSIEVTTVSPGGGGLVRSIKRKHRSIEFA